jgi:Pectate lyase superfamily protein
MDRRSFLRGSSTALVTLTFPPIQVPPRPVDVALPSGGVTGRTIFSFGAKGDGATDDSAAFAKAVAASYAGGGPVLVPAATYLIAHTIAFTTNAHCGTPWGFIGQGATLRSAITDGSDVIQLTAGTGRQDGVPYQARYLWLSGLNISGTGKDGNAIQLIAQNGHTQDFYNCAFNRMVLQNTGGDGLLLNGNIFESSIDDCTFSQNRNGLSCMHNHNGGRDEGVCSSISVSNCFFIKNRNYGLNVGIIGTQYGGATDVTVVGGYFRENGSYGAYWNNGMSHAMQNVGFENNCTSLRANDPTGAHVYAAMNAKLSDCAAWTNHGGSTNLLRGRFQATAVLTNCLHTWEGGPAEAKQLGLVRINGTTSGFVLMNQCGGNVFTESGNQAGWRAVNSAGNSPLGPLDPYGTVGTR